MCAIAWSTEHVLIWLYTTCSQSLEKETATHSRVLAWRIPGMREPRGLPSMGSHRVEHNWRDLAAAAILLHWSTCLFLYQYYTVLIPVALWYCLKSGRVMPLALFLFLRIALANLGLSEWLSLKSLQITSAREGVEKRELSYIVGGNISWWCNFGKQYRGSSES